jgi:hypothetical protein
MSRLFQVYEDDLQKLEHALPRIADHCGEAINRPELQVLFQEIKEIVSNIRWNYGPHTSVQTIPGAGNGK